MKSTKVRNSFFLVLTALIWGVAFVAQSEGGKAVGPYSFNSIRSLIGALVLVPVIMLLDRLKMTNRKPVSKEDRKMLIKGGVCCGVALFLASTIQQLGIYYGTGAGKAGFLTACYILIVPIIGLFLKKKCGFNVWIGVVITLAGLYLLCMNGSFSLQFSDILVMICAVCFSVHILVVDYFSPKVDGVRMSCIQFLVCGILCAVPMFVSDMGHCVEGIKEWSQAFTSWNTWIPILYAGVMSCGVAYTLQIVGQNGINPTIASLLMSLESVFSVIAGAFILKEKMSSRELIGCALIFTAIIIAQIPVKSRKTTKQKS